MPEGHLLHRHAQEQGTALAGAPLSSSSPQGKFADGAGLVDGAPLLGVQAHGKHLLYDFAGVSVHVHLGMRGLFLRYDDPGAPARKGTRWRFSGPSGPAFDLIAPSVCEVLTADGRAALLDSLGPDPLRADADAAEAVRRLLGYRRSVGEALLDQSVWAGPGNVYRAEVLYLAHLSPRRPAAGLDAGESGALWDLMRARMADGMRDGNIVTTGRTGEDSGVWRWVYKQESCLGCGAAVESFDLPSGRTCYACPVEQPL